MAPPAFDAAPRCALKDSGPARLIIDAVTPSVRPGSPLTLTGRIEASSDLGPVTLNVRADGSAHLDGPAELTIGAVKGGERVPFSIPVTFGAARGAVVVSSAGTSAEGEPWEYTTGAYAVPEAGGLTAGTGGYLCVQLTAIERARAAGLMSPEQARSASDDLLKIPGSWDSIPHRPQRLTTDQNQVYASMQNQLQLQPSSGCITVQGTVSWRDENELPHPAFGLLVEVFDEDLFGIEDLLTTTLTDQNGFYSVQVSDDDGLFQGGPDIFVRIRSEGPGVAVKSFLSFDSYHSTSGVHDDTGCDDSPIVENFAAGTGDPGPAFGLAVCGNWIGAYTSNLVGWLPPITVRWPTPLGSTFYNLTSINVLADDRWDWDVLMHEYGHYIQHETGIADNPGGDHSSASCLSETRDSKSTGTLLAWAEGWPTFNGVAAQYQMGLASLSIPRVGDIAYQDTQDQVLTVNLETPDAFGGEDNERGVMRTCWDLIDTGTDSGRDLVTLSDISLFSWIDDANAVNLSQAWGQIQGHLTMGQQLD